MMEDHVIKKHFMAVLGVGMYQECRYLFDDGAFISKFVQEACVRMCMGTLDENCRVSIFLTDDARTKNWEDLEYTVGEREQTSDIKEGEQRKGLKSTLEDLKRRNNIEVEEISIPKGETREEIDEMFYAITSCMAENEEVYFDITHGLRNIPMLVLSAIEYARVIKHITIGGVYYGAFEVGKVNEKDGIRDVLVYDLSSYIDILRWSKAASAFINYGNGDEIDAETKIMTETMTRNIKRKKKKTEEDIMLLNECGNLRKYSKALKDFTNCIDTGRGRYDKSDKKRYKTQNSIKVAYDKYKQCYDGIKHNKHNIYKPLLLIMDQIDDSVRGFAGENNLEVGMASIQWAIDNHMVQQGLTALEETMITYLCQLVGVPENNGRVREYFVNGIVNCILKCYKEHLNDGQAIFEKWKTNTFVADSVPMTTEDAFRKGKWLIDNIPKEFIQLLGNVKQRRNSINHFGFSNQNYSYEDLEKILKDEYEQFQKILNATRK